MLSKFFKDSLIITSISFTYIFTSLDEIYTRLSKDSDTTNCTLNSPYLHKGFTQPHKWHIKIQLMRSGDVSEEYYWLALKWFP